MQDEQLRDGRILIVDDSPANIILLRRILEQAGYTSVQDLTDSREVLARVRAFQPDLILLDLHMPHRDGIEVLVELRRELPADVYLPVLVISADTMQFARNSVLQFGAQDFLAKPFDRTEVLLRVGTLLRTRFLHQALQQQNQRLEERVRERTRELEAALEAASAASRAKSQFLANMGHELRTPLTALHGSLRLLDRMLGDKIPDPARRMLEMAGANGERLVRIIEDILHLQSIQSGAVEPKLALVSLRAVVNGAAAGVQAPREDGAVALRLEVPDHLPPVETDGERLQEVLRRLLENAFRFTERGSVTVRAAVAEGPYPVRVEVTDTGTGIPEDRLEAVFEPFEQADNSDARKYGGVGLGLTIARALGGLLGGRLEVESRLGEGSTFRVLLPAQSTPPRDA